MPRRSRRYSSIRKAAEIAGLITILATAVAAQDMQIDGNAALQAALQGDVGGRTLVLAPGTYDPVLFEGDATPAGIRSADPDNPATLLGLAAGGFEALRIENLVLDYRYDRADPIHVRPFRFGGCSNLVVAGNRIVGDRAHGRGEADDGFGYGIGLQVGNCDHVRIEGNHVSLFHRGMAISTSSDVTVINNELTALRMDGMTFSQMQTVRIEGNYIHNFDRSLTSEDHADMIQFWTTGAEVATHNVVIRRNILNSGSGLFTQSIFMRNELVDRGRAGREMFYRDILIEENVIINAHLHGITVGETVGLTIRRNTVAQNIGSISSWPEADNTVWRPTIRVSANASGVRIEDNMVWRVIGFEGQVGWRVSNNLRIQNRTLMDPAHYTQVFTGYPGGDPGAFETYIYRPEGPGGGGSLGSPLLRR